MLKWTKHHQAQERSGQSHNAEQKDFSTSNSSIDTIADSVDSSTPDQSNRQSRQDIGHRQGNYLERQKPTERGRTFEEFSGKPEAFDSQDLISLPYVCPQYQTFLRDSPSTSHTKTETTLQSSTLFASVLHSQSSSTEPLLTLSRSVPGSNQKTSEVVLPNCTEEAASLNTLASPESAGILPIISPRCGSGDGVTDTEEEPSSVGLIALKASLTSSPRSSAPVLFVLSPSAHTAGYSMAEALPDVTNPASDSEREILGPEVEWEEEGLSVSQIIAKDNFPCVGFFEEDIRERNGQWEHLSPGLKIYSRQPVLLHMHVKKRQARARTIYKNPRGAYYEVGQTMLIPDDYQGWFEMVPSDFSRAKCFMSIAEVANAMPRKFFTRSNVKGIRIEGEGEDQKYLERKVVAGSVLETRGTFSAKWKTSAATGTFKKKTKEWELQEVTYLKCVDKDQAELLVPLSHKGKFNAIYEQGKMTQNAVYSMKDILTDLGLPIRVRLLFGKAPVVPCIFTGMLSISQACADNVVVGSTLLNTRNVLFEIPKTAPVKMKYLSHDEPFREMTTYKDAQKLCKKYAVMFSTMIKLSPDLDTDQKIIQHMPITPSIMLETEAALKALDLITDISLTTEPKDHLLDSDSAGSEDQAVMPKGSTLSELTEFRYKTRESITFV